MDRVNFWRGATILACVLASTVIVVAAAGAKPKPKFEPKAGTYKGPKSEITIAGITDTFYTAKVEKVGKKYQVNLNTKDGLIKCEADGYSGPLTLAVPAPVKGRSFKVTKTVPNEAAGSADVTVKVSGHFTGPTAFSGTASAESVVEAGNPESMQCSTGPVTFSVEKE